MHFLTRLCFLPSAIIEHVRDGSVVRALLLPDYYLVTVMLSGIKVTTSLLLMFKNLLSSSIIWFVATETEENANIHWPLSALSTPLFFFLIY